MTIVGGHSRGAAFATIAAFDLFLRGHPVTMFNAGSPKAGNSAFVREYSKVLLEYTFRNIHETDLIPHSQRSDGLKHIPTEVWEYQPGQYTICNVQADSPWKQDPKCSKSVQFNLDFSEVPGLPTSLPTNTLSFFSSLKDKASSFVNKVENKVVGVAKSIETKVVGAAKSIETKIVDGVEELKNELGEKFEEIEAKYQQLVKSLNDHAAYFGMNVLDGENRGC